MKILFVGDIVGEAGRRILPSALDAIVGGRSIDFVIVNCENSAAGLGVTPKIADYLFDCGIDVLTSGNHIWARKEIVPYIDEEPRLIRPANYPGNLPGRGLGFFETSLGETVAVMNLMGTVFMDSYANPFHAVKDLVSAAKEQTDIVILDFHAEATSEKIAMGWHLDGVVSAVLGTHTHVQTADERVLPGGTAYITDVGMTGSIDSVIGMDREGALKRFLTLMPQRFEPAKENSKMHAVVIELDPVTGKASSIERVTFSEG